MVGAAKIQVWTLSFGFAASGGVQVLLIPAGGHAKVWPERHKPWVQGHTVFFAMFNLTF